MELKTRLSLLTMGAMRKGTPAGITPESAVAILNDYPAMMAAGVAQVLKQQHPDSALWGTETGDGLATLADAVAARLQVADAADLAGLEWNDFYLGRYSVGGEGADLRELVRRAKHRDGSTLALEVGGDILPVLLAAFDSRPSPLSAALMAAGFNPAALTFGNHPPGSETAFKASAAVSGSSPKRSAPAVPRVAAPVPAVAPEVVEAPAAAAPAPAARSLPVRARSIPTSASADLAGGMVQLGSLLISPADAEALSLSLVEATRKLQLPAEGYNWVDDLRDPQRESTLLVYDPVLGSGLADSDLGGLLRAKVSQLDNGTYRAIVYLRVGGSRAVAAGAAFDDMPAAKVAAAAAVRSLAEGE